MDKPAPDENEEPRDDAVQDGTEPTTEDPVFAAQMKIAEQVMRKWRKVLKRLAE